MKHCLPSVVLRALLSMLLLAALGSCSLYRKVHHPYRLPTPKPSPEYIAQQKAKKEAEKKRDELAAANRATKKKGDATQEAATDVSGLPGPSDTGAMANNGSSDIKDSVYPERSTVRYDKQELMKKPKLMRRRRHKHRKGFHPIESVRNFFKYGLHAKPNYDPDHRPAPKTSAEPDAMPDATPTPDGKP